MNEDEKARRLAALVGAAYPPVEPVAEPERFVRRWIVRCARELPAEPELAAIAARIARTVETIVRSSYSEQATEDELRASMPGIELFGIDDLHCVAAIELPTPSRAVGDVAAIGTWVALRSLDDALGIEDLQGLPKELWFPLR